MAEYRTATFHFGSPNAMLRSRSARSRFVRQVSTAIVRRSSNPGPTK